MNLPNIDPPIVYYFGVIAMVADRFSMFEVAVWFMIDGGGLKLRISEMRVVCFCRLSLWPLRAVAILKTWFFSCSERFFDSSTSFTCYSFNVVLSSCDFVSIFSSICFSSDSCSSSKIYLLSSSFDSLSAAFGSGLVAALAFGFVTDFRITNK